MALFSWILIFAVTFRSHIVTGLSKDDKIVVADEGTSSMYVAPMSANPDLSSAALTFAPSLTLTDGPKRVRYDAIEQKLYFTIQDEFTVARSNLDGTDAEVVFTDTDETLALALDEDAKKIYWSRLGVNGLFCTDYGGTTTTTLLTGNYEINNIALDKTNRLLYFTAESSPNENDGLWRISVDGTGLTKVIFSVAGMEEDLYGLALDETENNFFWSDTDSSHGDPILTADTPDGLNRKVLEQFFYDADVRDIAIYYNNLYMIASEIGEILRMPKDGSTGAVSVGAVGTSTLLVDPRGLTLIFAPPCVTDTLVPTATSTGELLLSWTPDATPRNRCEADEYQISYRSYDLETCSVLVTESVTLPWQSTSTVTVNGLAGNTYYQITLSSRNWPADGQGAVLGNSVYTVEPCLANLVLVKSPTNQQLEAIWSATTCVCVASEYQIQYLATDYCGVPTSGLLTWQEEPRAILPISGAFRRVEVSVTPRKTIAQTLVVGRPFSTSLDDITSAPTGPPTDITVSNVAAESFQVSWKDPTCDNLSSETLSYEYELTSRFGIVSGETPLKSVTFMNQRCGTEYTFRVLVVTVDGAGPFSNRVTVNTLISEEPSISELSFTSTSSEVEITWTSSECPPSSFFVEYELTLRDQCEVATVSNTASVSAIPGLPATLVNLLPFSTYKVSVTGVGSSGMSVTKSIEVTTKESIPRGQPSNVELTEAQASSLSFTWQSLPCTTRNGEVTYQYQLLQQSNVVISQRTSDTTATLSLLSANTVYEFQVAALTSAGIGLYTSIQSSTIRGTVENCTSGYCLNSGLCLFDEVIGTISCRCVDDFFGTRCELFVPTSRPTTPMPIAQSGDPGPAAILAIALSGLVGLIGTILAIGVFIYLLRRAATSAATMSASSPKVNTQPAVISPNSLQYMPGEVRNSYRYDGNVNYGY